MKNFNTFIFFNQLTAMPKRLAMVLIVLFTLGVGSMLGETIDFESTTVTYSNWTFTNMTSKQSGTITAKGGSYYGTTGGYSTASIQTKEKIASPSSLNCYISRQSNNTNSSTWYIQTSTNGSSWTNVKTQSATSMSKGSWVEFTADLSSYTDVYVRIYYSGSTAVRNIDNLVLESTNSNCTEPEITFSDGTYTVGASALDLSTLFTSNSNGAVTYSVTNANSTNATISGNKFTATAAGSATVTATQADAGTYCDGSATATITVNKQQTSITLSEAGNTTNPSGTFHVGDSYTLPSSTDAECGDKTFVGWSTVTIDNSANKPTSNFYAPGAPVTLGANNTFYAVFAESGGTGSTSWEKTDISGISSSDVVVITMSKSGVTYAMMNNGGTSSPPGAEKITINGNTIESTVYDTYKWNISNSSGNLTIYPNGTTTAWLYCTATNNGVRVGTNTNKTFTISENYLKHTGTSRYVGVYVANPDWRCYTSTTGNSNIAGQTLAFYKKTTTSGYQNYTTECSTPTEFTVSFDANGHGTAPDAQIVASGQKATAPTPAPTATGYTFGGWYEESECENEFDFNTAITADITLYAKWTAIQTTITLNANGGSGNTTSVAATYDSSTLNPSSITNPTKTGHTFGGWYSGEGGTGSLVINSSGKLQANVSGFTGTNGVWKATTDKTLYAKWTPAVYTITYKDQDDVAFSGTHEDGYPQKHTYNTETTLKSASKNHYTFGGWYKESDCSGTKVTTLGATEYTDNLTLYAQWTAKTYTITLDANGGTFVDNRDSQTKGSATFDYIYGTYANYNDAPNLTEYYSDLKRDGYQFDKWVSAGSPWNKLFTSTGDRTIQAQWNKLYSITLSENGTTTTPTTQTSTSYTLPTELTAGSCQDDTKELVGWSTVAIPNLGDKPTSNFYELGETVTLTADQTTFYAVFATVGEGGVGTTEIVKTETFSNQTSHASESNWKQSLTWDATESNIGVEWSTYYGKILANDDYVEIRTYSDKEMGYVWSSQKIKGLKSIQFNGWHVTESDAADMVVSYSKNNDNDWVEIGTHTAGSTSSSQSAVFTIPDAGVNDEYYISIDLSNATCPSSSNKKYRIDNISLTILEGSGTTISYSDYTTTCVKLPDPVLSFATEPANPIVFTDAVCGGNSSKQSVTVVGENLRDVVNVSVTGPYKIARTSSTALKDFTTSLTLDKTASGAIHSNYQTVYIISTPPAQSTEATTGTLTFTTTKGNTLTVNLSTPTVTCTQYTLTLVDRGVSTEQPTKYYAGETINEAPADPEGVCTDPIHYVFDGWAEATVAEGSTTYTKVTFPYTVEGNTKFYAVYRYVEEGSGDSGDYVKVTDDLDDYSGDYLFVYETGNVAFDGGRNNVDDELDATSNTIEVTINDNTIASNATTDAAKFTIAKVDDGYSIQSASGYYIGWSTADKNGLNANSTYSANYYLNTISNSVISGVKGTLKFNKTSGQERFRYYQSGQESIALYRKAASYLYTTSPVCGPHVEITSDKDIYITSGFANGRNTVIAQKKITFAATRLKPSAGGAAPSIKVPAADITLNGSKTDKVKIVDITQNIVLQDDGITYAGTGEITVSYTPTASNIYEDINVQLRAEHNTGSDVSLDAFTVHARSLPSEFVIVAKSGDKWYALNGDMSGSKVQPANGQVVLDNTNEPTKATYAPCNTIYTFNGMPDGSDKSFVRFIGLERKHLWAASAGYTGIQNNAKNPTGDATAYNWTLYTADNAIYQLGNKQNGRLLGLNAEKKFGMYSSAVQDIRILPYEAKCLYNYAPTNLKVSVLKGTYVTLTWDAVAGATKYQYSTDETNWTDAGTEPTVTISSLSNGTDYTYYVRAYHADAGVSQECFDYSEVSFTTADCDDVPTNITYTADLNSITVSWTAAAPTATIKLFMNEDGTGGGGTYPGATSPKKISGGLKKNTTYYIQILADGTCASPIIPVKTEDVEVDIVEWQPQGIVVDINTDETIGVTLENEVSYGSGSGSLAEDLFFSKYFEGSGSLKMIAIYNGTGKDVDLTDYFIYKGHNGSANFDEDDQNKISYPLSELGVIKQGQEIVLYSWPLNTNEEASVYSCSQTFLHSIANESGQDANPRWILCGKDPTNSITPIYSDAMNFNGDDPLLLYKDSEIIDVFGATDGESPENNVICDGYNENGNYKTRSDESWVANDVSNMDYGKTAEDFPNGEIPDDVNVDDPTITAYTARVIMFRKNSVTSGANAVTKNTDDFHTFAEEWEVRQVCRISGDGDLTCAAYQELGTFDYSNYYTKYETMGDKQVFEEGQRNDDGTVNVEIPNLDKQSCRNIRVKLSDKDGNVLTDREYKVPIMITTSQGTDGQAFLALQENLATVEIDGNGDPTGNKTNLTLEQVREICKTCDVVVRDNAILTKMADDAVNDHPEVHDIYVYENSSLIVPNGTNYTINNLSLRRKQDAVASVSAYPDALKLPESAAAPISLDFRLSAESWHWFTLPFDCNISEVTWIDGSTAQYNVDWFLMTYDGEKRATTQAGGCWKAYTGTTIRAGEGFILAINGNINNPAHTYELRFPMSKEVLAAEGTDKTVAVRAWGVETNIRPNHKGWNLVGNPYLAYYQRNNITNFEGLRLGQLTGPDPQTGYWEQTGDVPYVVVPVGAGWIAYEQVLASETDLLPFTAYFVQVGNDGKHDSSDELSISFDHTKLQLSATPMPASIIQRATSETDVIEPVIVGVSLTNSLGESDKTSLVIDNQFTDEYEMNADFFKWFGDYYKYYTKPVVYSLGADNGKRAFNALSEDLATQPISLGMYAAQAGNYTFTLDRRSDLSKVQEVWLYDATQDKYTNLMQDSYTFNTAKTESAGRFFLSVKMAPKVSTDINNVTDGTIWATTQDHTIFVNGLLSNAQLWIYDATGKLLHTDQTQYYQHTYQVPVSGTYFVRVQNTMQTQTIKVVVE